MYLAKPVMYLAICHVFNFCRLFKIVVVYLAIFVGYLAKPLVCIKIAYFSWWIFLSLL